MRDEIIFPIEPNLSAASFLRDKRSLFDINKTLIALPRPSNTLASMGEYEHHLVKLFETLIKKTREDVSTLLEKRFPELMDEV